MCSPNIASSAELAVQAEVLRVVSLSFDVSSVLNAIRQPLFAGIALKCAVAYSETLAEF